MMNGTEFIKKSKYLVKQIEFQSALKLNEEREATARYITVPTLQLSKTEKRK